LAKNGAKFVKFTAGQLARLFAAMAKRVAAAILAEKQ
jgi:hypothetical protein